MLKYPCLILDHDDTVVQSEATVNYPYFCYILDKFRPGTRITLDEYTSGCYDPGFIGMCKDKYGFTDEEMAEEYRGWKEYVQTHIPAPYPGIKELILEHKKRGGVLCVVSHSVSENITRDYLTHFGIKPDRIFGWDLPEEQRKPSIYPLRIIMDTYGFTKEQLLVVDDMKPAWEMARAAQVSIAFAGWGKQNCPQIVEEMTNLCDYSFLSTEEITHFLFR